MPYLGLILLVGAGRDDRGFCIPEARGDCIDRGDKLLFICGLLLPDPTLEGAGMALRVLTTGLCIIGVSPFNSNVGAGKQVNDSMKTYTPHRTY